LQLLVAAKQFLVAFWVVSVLVLFEHLVFAETGGCWKRNFDGDEKGLRLLLLGQKNGPVSPSTHAVHAILF
jgi:hypothetical protein